MQKLNPERDKELFRAFKRAYSLPTTTTYQQAIKEAIATPCSQFYVSSQDAYRYIRCRQQNKEWWRSRGKPDETKLRAFKLIYQRFLELEQLNTFRGCSTIFISSFACASPAPCFFLSYRRAYEIIRQMRKYGQVLSRSKRPNLSI